jgi:hypothetical protein
MLLKGFHSHTSSITPYIGSRLILLASLLKGPRSHTSSNAQIASSRLAFYIIEGVLLQYFQYYSFY